MGRAEENDGAKLMDSGHRTNLDVRVFRCVNSHMASCQICGWTLKLPRVRVRRTGHFSQRPKNTYFSQRPRNTHPVFFRRLGASPSASRPRSSRCRLGGPESPPSTSLAPSGSTHRGRFRGFQCPSRWWAIHQRPGVWLAWDRSNIRLERMVTPG